jgi:hypothetical protein
MAERIKVTPPDAKNQASESGHRRNAAVERAKRRLFGKKMTPGEIGASKQHEVAESARAEANREHRRDQTQQ